MFEESACLKDSILLSDNHITQIHDTKNRKYRTRVFNL